MDYYFRFDYDLIAFLLFLKVDNTFRVVMLDREIGKNHYDFQDLKCSSKGAIKYALITQKQIPYSRYV